MKQHKVDYYAYIQSPEWQKKRQWALTYWGNRCATCSSPHNLEVHHRTYERLGEELITDLIVLCDHCHETFHETLSRNNGPEHISSVLDRIVSKFVVYGE